MKFFILSSHAHRALDPSESRVSGGSELQMALLSKELAKRGHEVVLAGGDTGQVDGRTFEGVLTRTAGRFHTGSLADALAAFPRILQLIREHRPTRVVIIGWTAWLDLLSRARSFFGYKVVYICGLDPEIDGSFGRTHGWKGKLFERGVRNADYRFAMSE
ncbi:MAG: glycosyltransferase family 4 protein, partial [Chthoniobacterales bacterium]